MDIKLFDYKLPPELIAQFPAKRRDQSRLMVLDRKTGYSEIRPFKSIIEYLNKGDALVVNNTRVFKARLIGHRSTGAEVEIFLVRDLAENPPDAKNSLSVWEGLVRPSRRLKVNERIWFNNSDSVTLVEQFDEGKWNIAFDSKASGKRIISKFGRVPLPHYIGRSQVIGDISRYQTVFARKDESKAVAAPTAGLHFTSLLLNKIKQKGVKVVELTLDVGPGTFKPVNVDDINNHRIDPEMATLSSKAAATINQVRMKKGRVIAVGTTSVRTLESAPIKNGQIESFSGQVNLYIKPGFKFKVVDSLVTNFHLPRSSLLILVSAFAGRDRILNAYKQAVENRMRFYSYGDAMLID